LWAASFRGTVTAVGRSTRSLDSAKMSGPIRAPEIAIFAVAILVVLFVGAWYSIYILGQSEGAIGTDFDNLKISAVFILPVVAFSSAGYWLSGFVIRGALRRAGIIASAIASGGLVFAWPLIVPLLPNALNIVGFGVYCVVLGALSRIVATKWVASNGAV
jgi:hypothetical protein